MRYFTHVLKAKLKCLAVRFKIIFFKTLEEAETFLSDMVHEFLMNEMCYREPDSKESTLGRALNDPDVDWRMLKHQESIM